MLLKDYQLAMSLAEKLAKNQANDAPLWTKQLTAFISKDVGHHLHRNQGTLTGEMITVRLTSCLAGLELPILQNEKKIFTFHELVDSKPVKQVSRTVILTPVSVPWQKDTVSV